MSSVSYRSLTHLGMDVHKDSISVAILRPDDSMDVEKLFHDEDSVRRFIARMGDPRRLTACYEAGPTGYELSRQLEGLGVRCRVVAMCMNDGLAFLPSLALLVQIVACRVRDKLVVGALFFFGDFELDFDLDAL